ncbi:MAG: signal recognition particle subunit SRP19/SEC65 family protein [Thermoproteales archaeon]|nr:signal recognition particle subunit SRP19/SEC65 family protein [Thermoproteales archaeon]
MKKSDKRFVVLWTVYFDKNKSRRYGRKLPISLSVEKPSLKDLEAALKSLKYNYAIEETKKYPASWFDSTGRILVFTDKKKGILLKEVALKLKQLKFRK